MTIFLLGRKNRDFFLMSSIKKDESDTTRPFENDKFKQNFRVSAKETRSVLASGLTDFPVLPSVTVSV